MADRTPQGPFHNDFLEILNHNLRSSNWSRVDEGGNRLLENLRKGWKPSEWEMQTLLTEAENVEATFSRVPPSLMAVLGNIKQLDFARPAEKAEDSPHKIDTAADDDEGDRGCARRSSRSNGGRRGPGSPAATPAEPPAPGSRRAGRCLVDPEFRKLYDKLQGKRGRSGTNTCVICIGRDGDSIAAIESRSSCWPLSSDGRPNAHRQKVAADTGVLPDPHPTWRDRAIDILEAADSRAMNAVRPKPKSRAKTPASAERDAAAGGEGAIPPSARGGSDDDAHPTAGRAEPLRADAEEPRRVLSRGRSAY